MTAINLDSVAIPDPAAMNSRGVPYKNRPRGFLIFLGFGVAAVNGALLATAILTLPLAAGRLDANSATAILSITLAIGGLVGLVAYPAIGRLSDRTTLRMGRRRPYLYLGAALIAVGALLTIVATSTALLTVGYVVTTLGGVAALVAASALVPDQIAPAQRGTPSAMIGLGTPIGAVLGIFLAQLVQPNLTAMIALPAAVAVIATIALALFITEDQLPASARAPFAIREFLGTFWVNPVTHSSFGWAWWSRLMIFIGVSAVNAYQAFYLIIVLHQDPATVGTSILIATVILTGISVIFAPIVGKISDKVGRRKPFVIVAALVFGIGLALVASASTYPAFLIAIAVMGLGQGVYFAVDFALVTQVLPDPDNPAKDLGIMNLANQLPSTALPAVAPLILAIGASAANPQNFTALFVAGAIAAFLGALFILPIRSVK